VNCISSTGGSAEDYRQVYLQGTRNLIEWLAPRRRRNLSTPAARAFTARPTVRNQGSSPTEPLVETAKVLLETEKVLLTRRGRKNFPP